MTRASWSRTNPRLQLAWDATSWGALQKCARKYQYGVIEGWCQLDNPHLDFGGMFQEAVEIFQLERLKGAPKAEALKVALLRALQISGWYMSAPDDGADTGRLYTWQPWGGSYVAQWRCSGTEPYKNAKGNKAKCPRALRGNWHDVAGQVSAWRTHDDDPENDTTYCAVCDSPIERRTHYIPDHPSKHRLSLVRALALFADKQPETGGLQPYAFPDGTPAIEITIQVPMGRLAPDGDDYALVANIDEINTWRGRHYITDNKTTKNPLNTGFFRAFAPHAQFDFYDLVGSIALQDLDIAGLAVRGVQVTKESGDTKTALLTKAPGQREEAWRDLHYWLDQAEKHAADGYWPMNRASCPGCEFSHVCDMAPAWRERTLEADFVRRGSWDPVSRPGRRKIEESDQ